MRTLAVREHRVAQLGPVPHSCAHHQARGAGVLGPLHVVGCSAPHQSGQRQLDGARIAACVSRGRVHDVELPRQLVAFQAERLVAVGHPTRSLRRGLRMTTDVDRHTTDLHRPRS